LKIFKKYSLLTGHDIAQLLEEKSNFYLVTDKTNDFKLINNLGNRKKVYVEVFGFLNYIKSIFYNIKHPMYSLTIGKFGETGEYIKIVLLNPKYIVTSTSTVKEHEKLFEWIHTKGIKLFIYSSNDPDFIKWSVDKYDATLYTDFWDVYQSKCINKICQSY
jgi:hypothetical protein